MKTERNIFIFVAAFFAIVAPIYWFMAQEWAGIFVLSFAALLGTMIAGYLHVKGRHLKRPEDHGDGEIYERAGDYGFFPPRSIWPFVAALVVTVIFLGPALHEWWISILGLGIGIWACSGWVLEFYRGDYQH